MATPLPKLHNVTFQNEGGIGVISINRIERRNAFTYDMGEELIELLDHLSKDESVHVVIVTGKGDYFSAGVDLNQGRSQPLQFVQGSNYISIGGRVAIGVARFRKPLIAAINGSAVGIGITMTLPMDIRIVDENAKIAFPFTRRGMVPEACSAFYLPRIVGFTVANELCITGRTFQPREVPQLFNYIVAKSEVLPKAMSIAKDIIANCSPVSVSLTKAMLQHSLQTLYPKDIREVEDIAMAHTTSSSDFSEGVASFLQKRAPNWKLSATKDMPPNYPWWDNNMAKL